MKHIINGRSDGVNFLPEFRYRWSHAMRQMADKRVTVTVELYQRKRTTLQNSYYWPVLVCGIHSQLVADGWDITKEQVHHDLKAKFAVKEIYNTETGEVKQVVRSTTELSTVEFNDFCENIRRWAAETLEIILPEPNEAGNYEL